MKTITDKDTLLRVVKQRKQNALAYSQFVQDIIDDVVKNGDQALRKYTAKFDGVKIKDLKVPGEQLQTAEYGIDKQLRVDILEASKNIRRVHSKQHLKNYFILQEDGTTVEHRWRPIQRVGIYIPGGRYPLYSSVLMNVIPAQIAKVQKIVVCTPPSNNGRSNDIVLGVCSLLGVNEVYRVGGAQAIAAMAFGTDNIPSVDKIVGPGNAFVSAAKFAVSGFVGIDMIAGPTELVIIADETANPDSVAVDLISQAEHDPLAWPVLFTTDPLLVQKVRLSIKEIINELKTATTALKSLESQGIVFVGKNIKACMDIANTVAAEHVSLHVKEPLFWKDKIIAGAIFIGSDTPVAWGDYWAGSNHTLPTHGQARFRGPLSVLDFLVPYSVIHCGKTALQKSGDRVIRMALTEGLEAHSLSIKLRSTYEQD